MGFRGKYSRFKDYFRGPSDALLFLDVFFWAAALPYLIRRNSLDNLLLTLSPKRRNDKRRVRRIVVFVNWWLNRNTLMLRPICLNRSLLLYRFLRRDGIEVSIHYGIRKTGNAHDGHSWLTLNGRPFLQDGLTAEMYRETFVFPRHERVAA